MSRDTKPPVILLASANDPEHNLHQLAEEIRNIREALRHAKSAGSSEVVERPNATVDEVLDAFQDPDLNDRIAIFHFAGHANSDALQFLSSTGTPELAHAGGLGQYLLDQRGLQLVFLNGCLTQQQARNLARPESPLVIATSKRVKDEVARDLATRFYAGLASGADVRTSFNEAVHGVETITGGTAREIYVGGAEPEDGEVPWQLYPEAGADAAKAWKLPPAPERPREDMIAFRRSLFLLARPWLVGLVLGFVVLFVQSVSVSAREAYDGKPEVAWAWFLPNILPTLGALFAAIRAEQRTDRPGRMVSRAFFRLTFMISAFYIVVLMATLFALVPIVVYHLPPLEWLMDSSAYLGPLQGLTVGVVGYFYAAEEE